MKVRRKKMKRRKIKKLQTPPPRLGLKMGKEGNLVGEQTEKRVMDAIKMLKDKLIWIEADKRIISFRRNLPRSKGDRNKEDIVVKIRCGSKLKRIERVALQVKTSDTGRVKFEEELELIIKKLEERGRKLESLPKVVVAREHDSIFEIMRKTSRALNLRMS